MSTVDAVITQLVAVFAAACPAAEVIDGPKDGASLYGQQLISVGARVFGEEDTDTMGVGTTLEMYAVEIEVLVSLPGSNMQAARALVFSLTATCKQAVREYSGGPNLGLAASGVLQALPSGGFEFESRADGNGRHGQNKFVVNVKAQNT